MKNLLITLILAVAVSALSSGAGAREKMTLSLGEAIEKALTHNLDLELARITPEKERENVAVAVSEFDPVISAETGTLRRKSYDETVDSETTGISGKAGVTKRFDTGTELSLTLEAVNNDADADPGMDVGGDYTEAVLFVSHPLLKNSSRAVNLKDVTLAENTLKKARIDLKQAIIDTVSQAQNLYWEYFSALQALAVYEQSLALAMRFIDEVEEKARIGSAARLDILQARAEVASREEDIITARNTMENAKDTLLNYIYGHTRFRGSVLCLTEPSIMSREWDEGALIKEAMGKRTDYVSTRVDLDSADVNVIYYANRKKPELDVNLTLGVNDGTAGSDLSPLDQYHNYCYGQVVFSLKFPWGFRGEKADYAAAKLGKKQVEVMLDSIRARIVLDVKTALRDLTAAGKRVETTLMAGQYSRESLDAEQVKFRNGLSTSYNVLLYQRDLTDALVKKVNATIAYQTSLVALYKAVGTTLEINKIELEKMLR